MNPLSEQRSGVGRVSGSVVRFDGGYYWVGVEYGVIRIKRESGRRSGVFSARGISIRGQNDNRRSGWWSEVRLVARVRVCQCGVQEDIEGSR